MQLQDYVRSAWTRLPLILLVAVAVVLLGMRGTPTDPQYTARTQVLYSIEQLPDTADTVGHAMTQLRSLAEIVSSPEILQPVIDDLGLDESVETLAADVSATVTGGTYVLTVSATADSAEEAESLAAAVSASLVANAQDFILPGVVDAALVPAQTTAPTVVAGISVRDVVKNLAIGLVLGAGLSVLLDLVDPRVRTRNQLAHLTTLPIVGEVARRGPRRGAAIASQMVLSTPDLDHRVLLVLPAGSGEVHETVARRLAEDLVPLSSSVLLISSRGLTPSSNVASIDLTDAFPELQPTAVRERLADLATQFGSVVIVTGHAESSPLPLIIARFADSSLLVVDERRDTRKKTLITITALRKVGAQSANAVLVSAGRAVSRASQSKES